MVGLAGLDGEKLIPLGICGETDDYTHEFGKWEVVEMISRNEVCAQWWLGGYSIGILENHRIACQPPLE